MDYINLTPNEDINENGLIFEINSLYAYFQRVSDTRQVVYGFTSLTPQKASPRKLLALTRQHWGIESGLHYRRDVTLHEDATRLTFGAAGQNMAILNNLLIGLCIRHGLDNIAKARRLFCAQPFIGFKLIVSSKYPFL